MTSALIRLCPPYNVTPMYLNSGTNDLNESVSALKVKLQNDHIPTHGTG